MPCQPLEGEPVARAVKCSCDPCSMHQPQPVSEWVNALTSLWLHGPETQLARYGRGAESEALNTLNTEKVGIRRFSAACCGLSNFSTKNITAASLSIVSELLHNTVCKCLCIIFPNKQ